MNTYCPIDLKPCHSGQLIDRIADEFGVQVHPSQTVCTCHGEPVIDRREALETWWDARCRRENRKRVVTVHPFIRDIFTQHFGV